MESPAIAGYNGRVYVSTDGGATYIEFMQLKDVTLNVETDMMDASNHKSGAWKKYKPARKTWSATAAELYAAASSDTLQAAIRAALNGDTYLKFRFDPEGTAAGLPRREGYGWIKNWKESYPNSDLAAMDVEIQGDDELVSSTQ